MKHLVDIDDELLQQAQRALHTPTIKATVEEALRHAAETSREDRQQAWDRFGALSVEIPLADRSEAW